MDVWMVGIGALALGMLLGSFLTWRMSRRLAEQQAKNEMRKTEDTGAAAMGTIAAALAHELKTPLSTLDIHLQLLREEWSDAVSEREVRAHKKIQALFRAVAKLKEIVSSFLRFSQNKPLQRERTNLNSLIEDILQSDMGEIIAERQMVGKVQLGYDLQPGLPPVNVDRALIRQVLVNLLANAVEALPGEGRISIRTARKGREATVQVSDTGRGIAPEHLDKIWMPYFTTKPSGIGMGLAITRRIIQAHGGEIRVESVPSRGTTFTFSLPIDA